MCDQTICNQTLNTIPTVHQYLYIYVSTYTDGIVADPVWFGCGLVRDFLWGSGSRFDSCISIKYIFFNFVEQFVVFPVYTPFPDESFKSLCAPLLVQLYTFKMKFIIYNNPCVTAASITESRKEHPGFSSLVNVLYFLSTYLSVCYQTFGNSCMVWQHRTFIYKKRRTHFCKKTNFVFLQVFWLPSQHAVLSCAGRCRHGPRHCARPTHRSADRQTRSRDRKAASADRAEAVVFSAEYQQFGVQASDSYESGKCKLKLISINFFYFTSFKDLSALFEERQTTYFLEPENSYWNKSKNKPSHFCSNNKGSKMSFTCMFPRIRGK